MFRLTDTEGYESIMTEEAWEQAGIEIGAESQEFTPSGASMNQKK